MQSSILLLVSGTLAVCIVLNIRVIILDNAVIISLITLQISWMMSLPLCNIAIFCLASTAVEMRFRELNRILSKDFHRFRVVAGLHLMLVEVIQVLNRVFGFMLPMLAVSSLLQSTFSAYELFGLFMMAEKDVNQQRLGFAAIVTIFNVYLTSTFILAMALSSTAIREARKSLEICGKKRRKLKSDKSLAVLMSQLSHTREIVFGCGMFSYGWPLVLNYFTAVISYLMIFIQFDTSLMS
jgi:hypothetical protein